MKRKPYPKYKPSGVEWLGDVPGHWEVKRLTYCLSLNTEKAVTDENPIALENIESWTGRFIETESEFEGDGISFKSGDILFGKLRPYLAKIYLAERAGESIGDIFVLRPISQIISKYAAACLRTNNYIKIIDGSTYGSKMPRASWEFMGCLPFLIPPIDEQQAIAAFLDSETGRIDTLIVKKQKLIELLKEKRTAMISRAVTKGLNPKVKMKPSGVKWLGDVPGHWEIKKIKHLTKVISKGTTPSTEGFEILEEGEIRFIKAENLVENSLSLTPEFFIDHKTNVALCRSILEENDVLIVIAGATIGKVAILEKLFLPANTNQAVCFIRLKEKNLSKLVWYYMQSDLIKHLIAINAVQSAQPNISMGLLKELVCPLPPLGEQQAIADYLDSETSKIDTLMAKVETAIEKLKEYRIALISATVTGKIDVREVA